tara:strand:- start:1936 stop:2169 length:234 start_codon:yes stop_codon:yes gene_type:complete
MLSTTFQKLPTKRRDAILLEINNFLKMVNKINYPRIYAKVNKSNLLKVDVIILLVNAKMILTSEGWDDIFSSVEQSV